MQRTTTKTQLDPRLASYFYAKLVEAYRKVGPSLRPHQFYAYFDNTDHDKWCLVRQALSKPDSLRKRFYREKARLEAELDACGQIRTDKIARAMGSTSPDISTLLPSGWPSTSAVEFGVRAQAWNWDYGQAT